MTRYRFIDAPMSQGMRIMSMTALPTHDGAVSATEAPPRPTAKDYDKAREEVARLYTELKSMIEFKGNSGQIKKGFECRYNAVEEQLREAQQKANTLAFFFEDAAAPELSHSQRLRIYANKLKRIWERKS